MTRRAFSNRSSISRTPGSATPKALTSFAPAATESCLESIRLTAISYLAASSPRWELSTSTGSTYSSSTPFLGSPVHHVWLAPGATVELFEIHTRKEVTERVLSRLTETVRTSDRPPRCATNSRMRLKRIHPTI